MPIRMFPEMLRISIEKRTGKNHTAISGLQTLIVSTATRVGMGNLVGVTAAISVGGAGAVFWMWITALIGSSTAFIEGTLAQLHKTEDPLYGGYRGGPAYYIHNFFTKGKVKRYSIIAVLFAISGLICWGGISQVISNSVSSAFSNAFNIDPLISTVILVALAAVIVLRKNATVKVLDVIVPIMAAFYFIIAIYVIIKNAALLPDMFVRIFEEAFGLRQIAGGTLGAALLPDMFIRIFEEAFGLRQVAGGTLGAALLNGVKRGLFSNEAGSGSAPCAAAAADVDHPAKAGIFQAFGVIIDTLVICSCTAFIMLLAPESVTSGLEGMALLQEAMRYHFGNSGVIFIAVTLWLFSFSTFIGILFYARSNVAYLFGDNWASQTGYKIFALIMLFIGGLATYTFVWDLGDIGIGLMTVFNIITILPMGGQALKSLDEYNQLRKDKKKRHEEFKNLH